MRRSPHGGGQVMEAGGSRGEGVGLAVEFFGYGADEPKVDADVAKVAGDFFDAKHIRFGLNAPVNLGPKVGMSTLGRGMTVENGLEPVHNGFVVNEDVDRSFGTGSEVDNGEGLGNLGVLNEAMDAGAVVHAMGNTVIDTEAGPRQKGDGLIGTGSVSGCVGPDPPSDWVSVRGVNVRSVSWWGRSWDGLGKWVPGEFGLEVEERRVLIKEATVTRVRWEAGPLFVADESNEGLTLPSPTLTIADSVLLGLFFLVAITAKRAGVGGGVGTGPSLLGMVAARQVVEQKTELPGGALGSSFGASEPSAGEHVKVLADSREEAKVVALRFNLS